MSEVIKKNLIQGIAPIMSDEGILKIFNFYRDRCLRKVEKIYSGDGYGGGPSRSIRISSSKKRIDNLDFEEEKATRRYVDEELKKIYGSVYTYLEDDFPFGRFKPEESTDTWHGYDDRIYINAPFGPIRYKFILLYAEKCKKRNIPCGAKFFEKSAESNSVDNMIIYSSHKNIVANLEILEEIREELPEFAESCGSPIASGLNTSYYALTHSGGASVTWNYFFDNLSSKAFYVAMSKIIANNVEFYKNLTQKEKELINYISDPKALENAIKNTKQLVALNGFMLSPTDELLFKRIVERFVEFTPNISEDEIIQDLRDAITDIASLINFGDLKHKDLPISLNEKDIIALGLDASEFKVQNPNHKGLESQKEQEKSAKKVYSKERIKDIFDSKKLTYEAMAVGYNSNDIQNKTNRELRAMIFERVTLDNESIINILCKNEFKLKTVLEGFGIPSEEWSDKSKDELQRMFIEKIGLDEVIKASEEIKSQEEKTGQKRIHIYENTLQAMRMERGKAIIESEEYKALKTKEERRNYLDSFSVEELQDAQYYFFSRQNIQSMDSTVSFTM